MKEDFVLFNIKKARNALKQLDESEYESGRAEQLVCVLEGISSRIRDDINLVEKIVELDLHSILSKFIKYFLNHTLYLKSEHLLGYNTLWLSFTTFVNICKSEKSAQLNIKNRIIEMALKVAQDIIFLENVWIPGNEETALINELDSILKDLLYDNLKYQTKRDDVNNIGILDATIMCLLNHEDLNTQPYSDEFLQALCIGLKRTIKKSRKNDEVLKNTTYYFKYKCWCEMKDNENDDDNDNDKEAQSFQRNEVEFFVYANNYLRYLLKLSRNDLAKEKMMDLNVLELLREFLLRGNDHEKDLSCELMCSLCFNTSAQNYIREHKDLIRILKDTTDETNHSSTKRYCKQILEMVNPRVVVKKSALLDPKGNKNKHIMISYNHAYKNQCIEINGELLKKGFKTWIDVNIPFSDLFDAMATAVEEASVVLICYSLEYKDSVNCQYEAQYADNEIKRLLQ